jgi:uncharacterized membrane protein
MPFCSQCGNGVGATDAFCGRCGARQPVTPIPGQPLSGISPRSASILCYVPLIGWIAAIVFLASEKFRTDRNVRFHAFQGLYLFVAWLIVNQVVKPMFAPLPGPNYIGNLLNLAVLGVSIFMIVKTAGEETYSLPVLGELADKSLRE